MLSLFIAVCILPFAGVDAFVPIDDGRILVVGRKLPVPRSNVVHRMVHGNAFDFSSTAAWDDFYEGNRETVEWHSSVPLERIASYVHGKSTCLMLGCGNSRLTDIVLEKVPACRQTLLDSSSHCLESLRAQYGSSVDYVCGNALDLEDLLATSERKFDIVVDKGLVDALLCGDGWDGDLWKLFRGVASVLSPSGQYLLVSYKLGRATKEELVEIGATVGLEWEFDLSSDSNTRVGVSLARLTI